MTEEGDRILRPSEFKGAIARKKGRFAGKSQQDAQELLTAFLESVNEELSRVKGKAEYKQLEGDPKKKPIKQLAQQWRHYYKQKDDSVICDWFQGQVLSIVRCSGCKWQSVSFDNIWGLPVALKGNRDLQDLLAMNWGAKEGEVWDFECGGCKKKKSCSRTLQLFQLPEILVVQLKRFEFGRWGKQKIREKVGMPLKLDVSCALSAESDQMRREYILRSIVQHSGQVDYGHYVARSLSDHEGWIKLDDQEIRKIPPLNDSSQAYLLFYERLP